MSQFINVTSETEIRKLPITIRQRLASMLDVGDSWKTLMGTIPANQHADEPKKYSHEQISLIESEARRRGRMPFEILIDEWGTSGRKRPLVKDLINLLVLIENFQAADYLNDDILKKGPTPRPCKGPAARVNSLPSGSIRSQLNGGLNNISMYETINPDVRQISHNFDTSLPHVSYQDLELLTEDFNLNPLALNGRKLGAGAFGVVFLGGFLRASPQDPVATRIYRSLKLPLKSQVAVKRLHREKVELGIDIQQLFKKEVELMSRYVHENLLQLLAYSADGPDFCLVYAYMPNGSLEARLACEGGTPALQWNQRLDIAHGVAAALIYLHTAYEQPLVHRDVKSANVLLDESMKPKLGDFGLVRVGPNEVSKIIPVTENIVGTSAYMAPEAFRGDVSVKMDTFSYGVILLELLTGLPPHKDDREGNDLISHIEALCENVEFIEMLDPNIPPLPEDMVSALYAIALSCTSTKKKTRPFMQQVYNDLMKVGFGNLIVSL